MSQDKMQYKSEETPPPPQTNLWQGEAMSVLQTLFSLTHNLILFLKSFRLYNVRPDYIIKPKFYRVFAKQDSHRKSIKKCIIDLEDMMV